MDARRWALAAILLAACCQATAYDAARCAETRRNIAKLQADLGHGPTASDRAAFEQTLSIYRKVEPVYCGAGGATTGSAPKGSALTGPLNSLGAILATDPEAYRPQPTGPALPAPATPTGNVDGPMTMQRLGGTAPVATTGASMPMAAAAPSGFPGDGEIRVRCASAVNPSMCELALTNQRNQDPAYQQWKAGESARMDRNIDAAIANVDAAVDASQRQVIPVAPPPMPYDNSDPDLAKCREGSKAPWTIAGCYDLGARPPSRATTATPPDSLRDKLRRAMSSPPGSDDEQVATPSGDPAYEARVQEAWKKSAQARLLRAVQQGQAVVPENLQGRADCAGAWLYDGFGPGTCSPWNRKVVYAVDVPQLPGGAGSR